MKEKNLNLILNFVSLIKKIESYFAGLPHAHTTLIKSLINEANPTTGLVEGLTYRDLATILRVDPSPGRKGAGIPKKETIRSYLRTIADNCPNDFRLISQGQKLKCQFIRMPAIYAKFFAHEKQYTEKNLEFFTEERAIKQEDSKKKNKKDNALNPADCPKMSDKKIPVKNINNITNKQNKLTGDERSNKNLIAEDFYPNSETIAIALELGLTQVISACEIQKFIQYNRDNDCQWPDFNPVFIQWLKRGAEYQLAKAKINKKQGMEQYGKQSKAPTAYGKLLEQVRALNANALAPSDCSVFPSQEEGEFFITEDAYPMALDPVDPNLWPSFYA